MVGAPVVSPIPKAIRQGAVGLKVGLINTGIVTLSGRPTPEDTIPVWEFDMDPNAAGSIGVFFDVPTYRRLSLVIAADFYDIRFERLSERFIDISAGFKVVFYDSHRRIAFRPGAAVGLGYLADIGFMRPTAYLTLKAFSDLVIFPRGQFAVVFDFGFVSAPTGGNSTVDVSAAPSAYLRVGLLY